MFLFRNNKSSGVFSTIDISAEDFGPVVMEQILSAIHGLGEKISWEIWSLDGKIHICFFSSKQEEIANFITTRFPGVIVQRIEDFSHKLQNPFVSYLKLDSAPIFPIRSYRTTSDLIRRKWEDAIATVFASLKNSDNKEVKVVQIILEPIIPARLWRKKAKDTYEIYQHLSSHLLLRRCWRFREHLFIAIYNFSFLRYLFLCFLFVSPKKQKPCPSIENKIAQNAFRSCIRIVYNGDKNKVSSVLQTIASSFQQWSIPEHNSFQATKVSMPEITAIQNRKMQYPMVLCIEEIAGIISFPQQSDIPELVRTPFRILDPPKRKYDGISFAQSLGAQKNTIKLKDQGHNIIFGKSGSGKSTVLKAIVLSKIKKSQGFAVIDPHGDLIEEVLAIIPQESVEDVVLFDPNDTAFPIAFNILNSNKNQKVIADIVDTFKNIYETSWGPRSEYILYQVLSLISQNPDLSLAHVTKVLSSSSERQQLLRNCSDPVVRHFFLEEYNRMPARLRAESIAPILNKVNRFILAPSIRNILGQSQNKLCFGEMVHKNQIFLVNLAKGTLGETNSAILGSLIINLLQKEIFGQTGKRNHFDIIVDEVQNFASISDQVFQNFLSEGRKFGVRSFLACQYLSQLQGLAETAFGNVSTFLCFSLGIHDAILVAKFFENLTYRDLINLPPYHGYMRSIINDRAETVSFKTQVISSSTKSYKENIIVSSRAKYARPYQEVEKEIQSIFRCKIPILN